MNNQSSSTGVIVGILVALAVVIIGFVAYNQGYFEGKNEDSSGIEIKFGSN